MKFSVVERIELTKLLPMPTEANAMTFKILFDFKAAISFTEEEYKEFGIEQKDNRITWTNSKDKEILIGDKLKELLSEPLKKLNEQNKLSIYQYSLWIKLIEENNKIDILSN
jgi:hypothetical protein